MAVQLRDSDDSLYCDNLKNTAGTSTIGEYNSGAPRFYVGGTAAANLFDDCDRGTHSPTISSETNCTNVVATRYEYTKINDVVTLFIDFTYDVTASSTLTYFVFTIPYSMKYSANPGAGCYSGALKGVSFYKFIVVDSGSGTANSLILRHEASDIGTNGTGFVGSFSISYKAA